MLQVVVHHHKHGTEVTVVAAPTKLTEKQVIKKLVPGFDKSTDFVDVKTEVGGLEIENFYSPTPIRDPHWDKEFRGTDDPTDKHKPTQEDEALRAELAVRLFTDGCGERDVQDYHLHDLVTAILQFAQRSGFDPEEILERGMSNYRDEKKEAFTRD